MELAKIYFLIGTGTLALSLALLFLQTVYHEYKIHKD